MSLLLFSQFNSSLFMQQWVALGTLNTSSVQIGNGTIVCFHFAFCIPALLFDKTRLLFRLSHNLKCMLCQFLCIKAKGQCTPRFTCWRFSTFKIKLWALLTILQMMNIYKLKIESICIKTNWLRLLHFNSWRFEYIHSTRSYTDYVFPVRKVDYVN